MTTTITTAPAEARTGLGASLIHLDQNECSYPPGPTVQAELSRWWSNVRRYPSHSDTTALTEELARRHRIAPDRIVVGAGSASLLQLLARLLPTGTDVVAPTPTWEAYPPLLTTHGAIWRAVPMGAEGAIDLDRLAKAVTKNTSAVLVTSPHNPTGHAITRTEWEQFLERIPTRVLVILDEAYIDYLPNGHDYADGISTLRELNPPNLLVTRTFSKAYGLAGLRVGWAATTQTRARQLRETQIPFAVGQLSLRAATASLADDALRRAQLSATTRERNWLHNQILALGMPSINGHGNFLWLPTGDHSGRFVGYLQRCGIAVKLLPSDGIRITIGTRDEHDALLNALTAALR